MARSLTTFFARLRPPFDAASDGELLRRWADVRDPAAFELLVWRHGGLVLGTCRRVCRHDADAEDAFQATFLVLARKAGGVRASLPGWLHRTARRAAVRASRRKRETPLSGDLPAVSRDYLDADELAQLDAAVDGLGERHRRVVVLCYLQGHTAEAAAALLGVPVGTVHSRLSTARRRLAATLTRGGVALPALAATGLSFDRVAACVAATLNPRTAAPAAAIAHGVLVMIRLKTAALCIALSGVGVGVIGLGGGVALLPQAGGQTPTTGKAASPPEVAPKTDQRTPEQKLKDQRRQDEHERRFRIELSLREVAQEIQTLDDRRLQMAQTRGSAVLSPAMAKAKAELLAQIESTIFKTDVELWQLDFEAKGLTRKLNDVGALTFPAGQINQRVNITPRGEEEQIRFDNLTSYLNTAKGLIANRRPDSPDLKELNKERDELLAKLAVERTRREAQAVESLRAEAKAALENQLAVLAAQRNTITHTLEIHTEKRKALARELEGGSDSSGTMLQHDLERLESVRVALYDQSLQARFGVTPAAGPDARLDRVLAELAELRAEVKRLREGK